MECDDWGGECPKWFSEKRRPQHFFSGTGQARVLDNLEKTSAFLDYILRKELLLLQGYYDIGTGFTTIFGPGVDANDVRKKIVEAIETDFSKYEKNQKGYASAIDSIKLTARCDDGEYCFELENEYEKSKLKISYRKF